MFKACSNCFRMLWPWASKLRLNSHKSQRGTNKQACSKHVSHKSLNCRMCTTELVHLCMHMLEFSLCVSLCVCVWVCVCSVMEWVWACRLDWSSSNDYQAAVAPGHPQNVCFDGSAKRSQLVWVGNNTGDWAYIWFSFTPPTHQSYVLFRHHPPSPFLSLHRLYLHFISWDPPHLFPLALMIECDGVMGESERCSRFYCWRLMDEKKLCNL